ncbi:MAG: sigma-70 family RNA polymerase sigma factor [Candidatus Solibacter sp.]|nr:sigma-70 family RNA polymerase sigma factor [Candidatus Solibacter sp.]
MSEPNPGEITQLLHQWKDGNRDAFDQLMPLVYSELRNIATGLMRRERGGHTLQPTALLHELYFRLVQQRRVGIGDHSHFFAFAAKLMRMILIDHARARSAQRRGGPNIRVPLSDELSWLGDDESDLLDLNRALDRLELMDARKARMIELRFFLAFTVVEIAETLEISKATVDRDLKFVRCWLYRELKGAPGLPPA